MNMIFDSGRMSAFLSAIPRRLKRRTSSGEYVSQIDGLRFVAISTVVVVHIIAYTIGASPSLAPKWLVDNYEMLARGVLLFFVLSGFVIAMPFVKCAQDGNNKATLKDYFLRRLTRIEPPFLVAMLLTFAGLVVVHHASARALLPHLLATCTYSHAMIYGSKSPIAFITWSLEIEVQFYLIAPLIMMALALHGRVRRGVLTVLAIGSVVLQHLISASHPVVASSLLAFLPFFVSGIIACDLALEHSLWRSQRSWGWDLLGGLGLFLGYWIPASQMQESLLVPVLFGTSLVGALRGVIFARILSLSWLTAIGGMCYTIYLLHVPLIYLFGHATKYFLGSSGRDLVLNLLLIPLPTLLACSLFFLAIERPCMDKHWPHDLANFVSTKAAEWRIGRSHRSRQSARYPGPDPILLFAFEYPPVSGGISRLCAAITDQLRRGGSSVVVLTQEIPAQAFNAYLPAIQVNPRRPLREWQAFRWMRKYMTQGPIGATICGIWYPEGLIAYLAGVRPLVILAHGAELLPPASHWRRRLWNALQRRVLESADLVIANSDFTKELVCTVAPKANVESIPLAVDLERFAPGDKQAAKAKLGVTGKQVLCSVARIHRYKGHDTVFHAIAGLNPNERENLVYLIVGEGPHKSKLRRQADELGIAGHVRWLGFVADQGLPEIYRASDLFVLCTRDARDERAVEGFGLVFLEAQACGTPVVGTRTGGIPAAIEEGAGGWLIEQDDSQRLAEMVRELMRAPESFGAAGIQARERVIRDCTWERYGRRFSSALHSVGINSNETTTAGYAPMTKQQARGVSVVIPTLNRGSYLVDTITDLLAQEHRPLEILIVDQSTLEDPALSKLVREHHDLISYHKVPFRGLPLARNYGWQRAKYEAIVFVDDDIRCGESLVGEHLRTLSRSNIGMVAGGTDERLSSSPRSATPGRFNAWTATPFRDFAARGECFVQHVPGSNFSVWRSVLHAAGGFDEALAMGAALYEETELCLRVQKCGFEIYFNGAARVQHLAAGNGGCRVPDLPKYMGSLAHNRAIMIGRHLRWFQIPVAYLRLLLLFASYAAHYRTLNLFGPGFTGLLNGAKAAKRSPLCSRYGTEVPA